MTMPGPIAIAADDVTDGSASSPPSSRPATGTVVVLLAVLPEAAPLAADLEAAAERAGRSRGAARDAVRRRWVRARLIRTGRTALAGRDVLVVTAIVDTGLRLRFAIQALQAHEPSSLSILTLLDRPDRRIADIPLEHVGFTVPDCLFAGYGLGREPELMALRDVHYRDSASAERARRGRLQIA